MGVASLWVMEVLKNGLLIKVCWHKKYHLYIGMPVHALYASSAYNYYTADCIFISHLVTKP